MVLDYILYDNRTPSVRAGRDWDIKRATGVLSEQRELHALVYDYARLTRGLTKVPTGFGEAVGLIRSQAGYLLCVTLEAVDAADRRSYAVVGLWCPNYETLRVVVRDGDPVASARVTLDQEPPRTAIHVQRRSGALVRRLSTPNGTTYLRFKKADSVTVALGLIAGATAGDSVPAILGITAASNLPVVASQGGFNVVFGHPTDDGAEETLRAIESSIDVLTAREQPQIIYPASDIPTPAPKPNVERPVRPPAPPSLDKVQREPSHPSAPFRMPGATPRWIARLESAAISTVCGAAGGALMYVLLATGSNSWRAVKSASVDTPRQIAVDPQTPPPAASPIESVNKSLESVKALDPDLLRASPGYVTADNIQVTANHEEDRSQVRKAYATLLKRRDTVTDQIWMADINAYVSGTGKGAPATERKAALKRLIDAASVKTECEVLARAFGDEMSASGSVTAGWCHAFALLETSVRAAVAGDSEPATR